ncbi:hypothetical protein [Mycolicibacterium vaccae]|uniref:DUF1772 domain-containing protein n=1 Tax=Mycolicibacterium vaccae ATCC 25954 TaxID=1194972 RepID=K0UUZ7_MYCVA|nr:hypothetical protein [Mycolicibacterium vaccae]ANI41886.1 hypothetical protein MYVA_4816 [Mycolicibacterium vaccae 95051]EJZ08840.1 hypothetical protein MVAC_14028 [Mycolicibacterium vaccae ATCC 25954]MCV7062638.1 hypothetical protein [Mycolicibacterium vaccae]
MGTPTLILIATTALAACVCLGAAVYEALVVDPYWPRRPGIIQSHNGGISRVRFWLPAPLVFEVLLVITLVMTWGDADVGVALLVALASQAAMRLWTLFDLIPQAAQFERTDPADVDEAAAVRWTRKNLLRLPLLMITSGAMLTALALA